MTFIYRIQNVYTFKITYIFIIYNLIFFPHISISVHSTLFNLWVFFLYWCYISSLLCYSYACLYFHACLHYVNKKWSDKDTDCTCCVYCILKLYLKITRILAFRGYMTWTKKKKKKKFERQIYSVTTRRPAGSTLDS